MRNIDIFQVPQPTTVMARTSSITNAFVNGIIPSITPTEKEIGVVLDLLGMNADTICCAYCGGHYSEWDHFRPIVKDKKPTGYITEINNLVPSCNKCNSSKGNRKWREWIESSAKLSPKTRGVEGLNTIVERLETYERYTNDKCVCLDFENIVSKTKWEEHWNNHKKLLYEMRQAQTLSNEIKNELAQYVKTQKK